MSAQDSERFNAPQSYRGGSVPAPHSPHAHPEPGRSATGWYVLVLLTVAALASIWLSFENWGPGGLADNADDATDLRAHYQDITSYGNALTDQNEQMTEMRRLLGRRFNPPAPPDRSILQQTVASRRATLERLVRENTARCRRPGNQARCDRSRREHDASN